MPIFVFNNLKKYADANRKAANKLAPKPAITVKEDPYQHFKRRIKVD